jgi:hypothetical protein
VGITAVQRAAASASADAGNEQFDVWRLKLQYLFECANLAIQRLDCEHLPFD